MSTTPAKSTSLTELGYTVKPATGKDSKGNEVVYKVTGPPSVYFIKKTKKGRLVATKEKDSVTESTISGLFNFQEHNGDLVGQRASVKSSTPVAA